MAPAKQTIRYPLGFSGLDQRADAIVQTGKPQELRNVRFNKNGRLTKRRGHGDTTGYLAAQVAIKSMIAVGENGILSLGLSAGVRSWYTYEPTVQTAGVYQVGQLDKGDLLSVGLAAVPKAWTSRGTLTSYLSSPLGLPDHIDVAHGQNHTCWVVLQPSHPIDGFFTVQITDERTGRVLRTATATQVYGSLFVGAQNVRVLNIPGTDTFVVGAMQSFGGGRNFIIGTFSVGAGPTLRVSDLTPNNDMLWDWAVTDDGLFVATHNAATATRIVLAKYDTTTWASASANIDLGVAPTGLAVVVPYSRATGTKITVLAFDTTNGLRGVRYNSNLTVANALWVVQSATTVLNFICGAELATGNLDIYNEQNNASVWSINVRFHSAVVPGSAAASTTTILSARLASKPIVTSYQNKSFVLLGYTSADNLQHSLFLYSGADVAARFTLGFWKGSIVDKCLGNLSLYREGGVDSSRFLGGVLTIFNIVADRSGTAFESQASLVWWDMDDRVGYASVDDEDGKLICGGFLQHFDGNTLRENGFLLAPEIVAATGAAGGALPVNGSYSLKAVVRRVDARGRIHRSAASNAVVGTTGAAQNMLNVSIRLPTHTMKPSEPVQVELYRTANGQQLYYLETVVTVQPSVSPITGFSATASDTTLVGLSPLTQQGGIQANQQPSCPIGISTTGRRVQVIPGDDRKSVVESKERQEGTGLAFFDTIERRITPGGELFALSTVGERWVAFKKRGLYQAAGEGADDAGAGDNLSEFEQFSIDTGSRYAKSIVVTTYGTIFRSEKGFQLLSRDGGLVYLGDAIQEHTNTKLDVNGNWTEGLAAPVDSAYDADAGIVYFLLADATMLVLTLFKTQQGIDWRWSIDDGFAVTPGAICVSGARLCIGAANASTMGLRFPRGPDPSVSAAAQDAFSFKIRSGWIPLAGDPNGRGRLLRALWIGRNALDGAARAKVSIAYDYKESITESRTLDEQNGIQLNAESYAFEFRVREQRHRAVMVLFEDQNNDGTPTTDLLNEAYELFELALEVSAIPGAVKFGPLRVGG